jgi:hypothetical protein
MEKIVTKATSVSPPHAAANHTMVLIIGDTLALLLFVLVGRRSHTMLNDFKAILVTAAPFVIAWFLVTPWFDLFRASVSRNWRKLIPRLLLAWAIGGPLALVLRALLQGRPVPGGIIPSFVAAALGFTTLFLLVWRLGYAGWMNHRKAGEAAP